MKPLADCYLYTFVDTPYLRGRRPELVARQLCDGGSDIIQLRTKTASEQEIERMAEAVKAETDRAGVRLVINDFPEIAARVGASTCHLGQEDFFDAGYTNISQVRPVGSPLEIGLSTHAPEQCGRAVAAGADYVAIGPVYATGTKPTARPVTLDYVRWAKQNVHIPWFAIGGINLATMPAVLEAGASRICVVSAILNEDDIAGVCCRFKNALEGR